jgi:thioredoxin reductase (NADPH)
MVVKGASIGENVKYWVRPDIDNRIKEGSIKCYFNSQVLKITPATVEISTPEGRQTLENDFVLAMTGYQPPFAFMESLGIRFHNDEYHTPVYDDVTMETNVPNLFLAGVICGGLKTNKWFIENSRVHAEMILKEILKRR